ncbi:hypothetical protein LIER_02155 [Lithospermum erythrorhizon]|uniref:Reverse transcriptase domain-containing protein n=1 Tax=Lithospermum erythrorhizon TaxID=34254 RepID=A0AAV3NS57_LITER
MKFPTPGGIGEICGDQKRARICYQTSAPPLNARKNEQNNKRVRENHMEVNLMRNEEEEDNSPKKRERGKKGEPHEDKEKGIPSDTNVPADEEKTTFITKYGLYCWNVMPFGLKNSEATYLRIVNSIFVSQIGRNMEIYVDDMLVKSKLGRII